ncbi:hypothetical protein ACR77J_16270, partial [Tissierella praeacuta]|uniref:hypothetical protein n=1 Tax=Tissierella praeacuta TaxID=43131 RepID=UPI003DA4D864
MGWELYTSASKKIKESIIKYITVKIEKDSMNDTYHKASIRYYGDGYSIRLFTDELRLPIGTKCRIECYVNYREKFHKEF